MTYQNLSKEKKKKLQQYDCERYKNLSEDEKQKLVEHRSKNIEGVKALYYNDKKLLFKK